MMLSRNEYSSIVRHRYKWRAFCGAGSRLSLLSLSPVTLFPFRSREFCVMYGPTHSCPPYHLYVHLHSSLRSVPERRRDRPRAGLRVELRGPRPAQGVSAGSSWINSWRAPAFEARAALDWTMSSTRHCDNWCQTHDKRGLFWQLSLFHLRWSANLVTTGADSPAGFHVWVRRYVHHR